MIINALACQCQNSVKAAVRKHVNFVKDGAPVYIADLFFYSRFKHELESCLFLNDNANENKSC